MKNITIITILALSFVSKAQGGFNFLKLSSSAREAALGGNVVSNADGDVLMALGNPAILDSVATGSFGLMFNPYFADISRFSAIGNFQFGKMGELAIGTIYTDFGKLIRRDLIGNKLGEFAARNYVISVGKSHRIASFSIGGNLKFAQTIIDSNSAAAILIDIGGIYLHPERELYFGLVFTNVGWIVSDYSVDESLSIPFDVELGTTFKPQYMPVRFTFTVYNLTDRSKVFNNNPQETLDDLDKVLRHLNLAGEIILGKNVEILLGYNQKRRQELKLTQSAFGSGWSYGMLVKIKDLDLRFSRSTFHAAGGTSFISLQSNINSIKNVF